MFEYNENLTVKNLKKSRIEILNLTRKELSKILDVSDITLKGWENEHNIIPLKRLLFYANHYDLSLDYLFGIIPENTKYSKIEINIKQLGQNLKNLRNENNMTEAKVATKINTTQSNYSHYETGTNLIPTVFLYNLIKIYKPFSIDKLFERENITNKKEQ